MSRQSKCVDRDSASSSGEGPPANRPPQSVPSLVPLIAAPPRRRERHEVGQVRSATALRRPRGRQASTSRQPTTLPTSAGSRWSKETSTSPSPAAARRRSLSLTVVDAVAGELARAAVERVGQVRRGDDEAGLLAHLADRRLVGGVSPGSRAPPMVHQYADRPGARRVAVRAGAAPRRPRSLTGTTRADDATRIGSISPCRPPWRHCPGRRRRCRRRAPGCAAIRSAPPAGSAPSRCPCSTSTWPSSSGWVGVQLELGAGVGDVEVAHRQLADPVGRPERGGLHALHRQLVRVVGERRAVGAQDRVVLAAPQPQRHLAGDQRGDPALHRLAQHQRLRVEPAALVEQPAEPAALVVVGREGVLVVDRVEQPLVGDPEQRHARRLVDAARLGLDDPVLDLVGHAEPVPAADLVDRAAPARPGRSYVVPFTATGRPLSKRTVTSSGSIATAGSQNRTPMIGSTVSSETSRCSSVLASWVAPQMLASVEYAFSALSR